MALEDITAGSTIADLDTANPVTGDPVSQGDDHIRNLKKAIQQTFMNLSATVSAVAAELDFAHKGGTVSGTALFKGALSVSGALVAEGTFQAQGTATFSGPVVFKGSVTMEGNLAVSATISASIEFAQAANYAVDAGSAQYALSADFAHSASRVAMHNIFMQYYDVIGGNFSAMAADTGETFSGTNSGTGKYCISHKAGAIYWAAILPFALQTKNHVIRTDSANLTTNRTAYQVLNMDATSTASRLVNASHYVMLVRT